MARQKLALYNRHLLKYIISFVIAGFCFHNLYAQTMTLSAEIVWKKKDIYLLNYDTASVPFIRFTYKNNTADSIYFYNSLKDLYSAEYLNFQYDPGGLVNFGGIFNQWNTLINSFPNWSDNEYTVIIVKKDEYRHLYKRGETKINRENIEKSNEHYDLSVLTSLLKAQLELDRDNINLQYEFFHHPYKIASTDKVVDYLISKEKKETFEELVKRIKEEISNINVYDYCVFLKPYESFSFEYDLTPFFLLKGSYNFIIEPQMPKYVKSYNNYVLPDTYNRYKLYTGQLNGVNVELNIPRK